VLDLLAAGRTDEVLALRERYATEAQADSQFRALAFLAGSGACDRPARVLEYGPVWGTGAAVVTWPDR
jgi:2-aminophenol/2-amino-5-chlorophenol 1,6-dioxygenase subunit alpha